MTSPMHTYLSFLMKPASSDCNLFCDYCFYRKTAEDYPETTVHRMSEETLRMLVEKAQTPERKAVGYIWQGGEPMLMGLDFYKMAVEIQTEHQKPGQQISNTMQTNAINIDDEWAVFFRKNNVLVGVSMDGPKELYDMHRFTRARSSVFEKVTDACDVLDKHNVDYNILAVVNNDTVKYPEEIYTYFRDKNFHYLQFIDCVEAVDGEIAPFSVDPHEYGKFLCKLFDLWLEDGYPRVSIRFFDNYLQYRAGMVPECCMYKNNCGEYFVVEHNGDMFPCDFFVTKEWNLGNINTDEIAALIDNPLRTEFADKRNIPHDDCEVCPWFGFCQRSCIKFRYLPDFDYSSLNIMCESYKMFFEHADKIYNFLAWDIMRRHRGEPPPDIGRNDPCVCRSGKKYKKCCEEYSFLFKV
ncbi:anaerobic sulfatase maturase [Candidatus Latescibacterota bacterium]